MNILTPEKIKEILITDPNAQFSLQEIRVKFTDCDGYVVAGYHIIRGHMPGMIQVRGQEIWNYIGPGVIRAGDYINFGGS